MNWIVSPHNEPPLLSWTIPVQLAAEFLTRRCQCWLRRCRHLPWCTGKPGDQQGGLAVSPASRALRWAWAASPAGASSKARGLGVPTRPFCLNSAWPREQQSYGTSLCFMFRFCHSQIPWNDFTSQRLGCLIPTMGTAAGSGRASRRVRDYV